MSDLLRNAYKHQHVPGFFAPKDVKDYEWFSFVTGEKQRQKVPRFSLSWLPLLPTPLKGIPMRLLAQMSQ